MDAEFWHERWQRREIGFHRDEVHPFLPRFFPGLSLPDRARVLVPLCGKSRDLLWLCGQGCDVLGVELSLMAVEEFFAENDLLASTSREGEFSCYQSERLQIYCGDFFQLKTPQLGPIDAIYDRAALVALPPEMRADYTAQLLELCPAGKDILTISYDYPQAQMDGPPFSVPEAELRGLFGQQCTVEKLHSESALGMHKKMQDAGLSSLQEEVYRLRRL